MTSGPMKASVSKEVDSNSENKTCGSLLPSISYIYMRFPTHMHRSIHEIDFHFLKCIYFKILVGIVQSEDLINKYNSNYLNNLWAFSMG